MLRSFRVANHRSIRDEQELVLLPAYDKSRPALPVVGIFGANASGKSNFFDALEWMRTAVLTSFASWQPGAGVPRRPFRLDGDMTRRSLYSIDVELDGVRHAYGFEVDDQRVVEEWLYIYPHNRRRVIFERERDEIHVGSTVHDSRSRTEVLRNLTRANALFLGVAALNNVSEVAPLYEWFRSGMVFGPEKPALMNHDLIRAFASEDRDLLVELIKLADLGITDVVVEGAGSGIVITADLMNKLIELGAVAGTEGRLPLKAGEGIGELRIIDQGAGRRALLEEGVVQGQLRLAFRHGESDGVLGLEDQSAGTRRWMDLACDALKTLRSGGVLVVDEVDASLHPTLTARIIGLFKDRETNPAGAQFIMTTHDATLIDEDILARDEVWFVEKDNKSGVTRLFPLTDFHPRKNEDRQGRYLTGAYGAIPLVSEYEFRDALRAGTTREAA